MSNVLPSVETGICLFLMMRNPVSGERDRAHSAVVFLITDNKETERKMYKEIRGFTAIGLLKVLLVLSTLVWAAIVDSLPASADAIPDQYSGVTITDATAQAAPSGGNSVLRFRLVNEGTEPLTLLGVTSEQITESRILGQTSHGTPESLGSINIPVEERSIFRASI